MTLSATLKQLAYDHIRRKLISGEFPSGTRRSTRALAREIGISVIPVREAISQLASEGLVEHKPGVGSFAVETSRQDLEELYDLREALECHAIGRAAECIREGDLAGMQTHIDEMSAVVRETHAANRATWNADQIDRWVLADAEFHMALLHAAGNRRAIKMLGDLRVMTYVFGHRNEVRPLHDPQRVRDEHQAILDALRRGDAKSSREVMSAHLRRGCRDVLAAYDRRRIQAAAGRSTAETYPGGLHTRQDALNATSRDLGPDRDVS